MNYFSVFSSFNLDEISVGVPSSESKWCLWLIVWHVSYCGMYPIKYYWVIVNFNPCEQLFWLALKYLNNMLIHANLWCPRQYTLRVPFPFYFVTLLHLRSCCPSSEESSSTKSGNLDDLFKEISSGEYPQTLPGESSSQPMIDTLNTENDKALSK